MKKNLCLFWIPFICSIAHAQPAKTDKKNLVYFSKEYFQIGGTRIAEQEKENAYDRLPLAYKEKVRKEVWDLSKSSAGITVSFITNATTIAARWTVLNNFSMNHMAASGVKGVDLYVKEAGQWQYVNTGRPASGKETETTLISNMKGDQREYRLYLPLYDGVVSLQIGIDSGKTISKPKPVTAKPIIFYGTSITQGGCASRPGMAHTNIIGRKLDIECVNLGFSGNGRMEQPLAELLADTDALLYVIDCVPNMSTEMITANTGALVATIRKKRPTTPIVLVENTFYETAAHDLKLKEQLQQKNSNLRRIFDSLRAKAVPHLYYVPTTNALGSDHEGTVDGVHFTDLGFSRFADHLITAFRKYKLLPSPRVK